MRSDSCVVKSIEPLNITTLGRRRPDLGSVHAAHLARPSRRRRSKPPSPTASVQQIPRPIPPLHEHRSAIQRTPGVSTSSNSRGLASWSCASVPASSKPIRDESSIWRSARRWRFFPPSETSIDRGADQGNTLPVDAASPVCSSPLTSTRWVAQRSNPTLPPSRSRRKYGDSGCGAGGLTLWAGVDFEQGGL